MYNYIVFILESKNFVSVENVKYISINLNIRYFYHFMLNFDKKTPFLPD